MKKLFYTCLAVLSILSIQLSANDCRSKGDNFIFAGGECIQYHEAAGELQGTVNIVVHGTWDLGTNTLGRYSSFADDLAMQTDITTVAVALPGYSGSSTNKLKSLADKSVKHAAATKEYIIFMEQLVKVLKEKYNAQTVNYIGHSAGAMMGATLTGYKPGLIDTIMSAGGSYDIHEKTDAKGLISIVDVIDSVDKKTKFLLVYGTDDKISKPHVTKDFYTLAKQKGLDVTLIEAKGAAHIDLDMTDESVEGFLNMIEEE